MKRSLLKVILLAILLILGVVLVLQRQLFKQKAGGTCLLCLFAPSPSLLVGQSATTILSLANPIITPNDKGIIGIKAVLAYPSSALSVSQAIIPHLPSPWTYTSTTGTTTEISGTTYLTIEAIYNQPGITGQLTLADPKIATVNFLISSPGVHTISIDILQSHIYAKNANEDILVGSFPSSLDLRATTLGTMAVQIEPGLINTTTTHAPIYLSTRAVKEFTRPTDFTYEWGLSSTGSIGNLKSDPNNPLLATFIPQNPGTGSLWVKATDPNNNTSVIKTISVYVSVSPQCVDTDGGFNTQISGAASIPDTNSSTRIEIDTCAYQNPNGSYAYPTGCYGTHCYLIERFCSGDSLQESQVSCSQGCSNGACLTPDTTPNPTVAIPTNTPTPPTTTISPTPTPSPFREPTPTRFPTPTLSIGISPTPAPINYIDAYPSCYGSQGNLMGLMLINHIETGGTINMGNPSLSSGIWETIKEESTGQLAYLYFTGAPSYTTFSMGNEVNSIRGSNLTLIPDGRTYTAAFYTSPYTEGVPVLAPENLITSKAFSKICPEKISMTYVIKFQTSTVQPTQTTRPVSVVAKRGNTTVYSNSTSQVHSNGDGTWNGTVLLPITGGTFDLFVKSKGYLQSKFSVNTSTGNTPKQLVAGDFNNDNKISFLDISMFLNTWTSPQVPVTTANQHYDLNFDGTINFLDVSLLLNNWTAPEIPGDN